MDIRRKRLSFGGITLFVVLLLSVFNFSPKTNALSGSEFNAGRIIDDAVFFNSNSMSVAEIQSFLNNKVTCDTNGSKMTGGITRAQYAAQRGWPTVFTCLPQYRENPSTHENNIGNPNYNPPGSHSAAQIIYNVSSDWGVSSKALIVLLQKEQGLVTDEWPVPRQYQIATGYGCPDTAPCDEQYYGFVNQLTKAAYQFKRYVQNSSGYRYRAGQVNSIYWSPTTSCGASNVYIENGATAALYNYTPYRPNQAALNNLYGTGDGCSAYGNRNFWRYFRDWFGTVSADPSLYSAVVKDVRDGKIYLATYSRLHYIPSQEIADAWGIDLDSAQEPPLTYFASRSVGPNIVNLAKDRFGNVFVMDGGERHYVQTSGVAALWGLNIQDSIQADGFINSARDGRWLSKCVGVIGGSDGWIGDTNVRHLIGSSVAKAWGCNSATGMYASTSFVERLQPGGAPGRFVQFQGKRYLVEAGSLWSSSDNNVVSWYNASGDSYFNCSLDLCSTLPKKDLNWLAEDISTGRWYVIEAGKKRYVKNGKIAKAWGFENFSPRSLLSNDLLDTLANGADLGLSARSTAPVRYYILGGDTKHYIPNQTAIDEWVPEGEAIDSIDVAVLNKYVDGDSLSSPVSKDTNGQYYILQGGVKYPIESRKVSSWSDNPINVATKQVESMDTGISIGNIVYYDVGGQRQYFAVIDKKRYQANYNQVKNSWALDQAIRAKPSSLDRYALQSAPLSPLVRLSGKVYSLSNLKKKELNQYILNRIDSSKILDLSSDVFDNSTLPQGSSYLLKDNGSSNIWLVSTKGKVLLTSTAQALNLGYISMGQEFNQLDIETINLIPNDNTVPSLVVRSPSGSMKLVSFGGGLGFGDADTALAYIGVSGSVVDVSQSIFDSYGFPRNATRLIRDDAGKVYWLEGGKKRWILNGGLLGTRFNGITQTYLHSTVMTLIPDGTVLN
ncbi:MAG: hypothetical protein H6799_02155 [Candidatus Nomurabacteria bacterium]|nr:MAG: hypothetical protein H6799_02155 [Candidatus Nomurabacteria bacterium]